MRRSLKTTILLVLFLTLVFIQAQGKKKGKGAGKRAKSGTRSQAEDQSYEAKGGSGLNLTKIIMYGGGGIGLLAVGGAFIVKRQAGSGKKNKPKTALDKIMDSFEKQMGKPSELDEAQKSFWMANLQYKQDLSMEIKDDNKRKIMDSKLRVVNYQQDSYTRYNLTLGATDSAGASTLQGIVIFPGNKMALKLSKLYTGEKHNDQKYLFFEGMGNAEMIYGRWSYSGSENAPGQWGYWTLKTK